MRLIQKTHKSVFALIVMALPLQTSCYLAVETNKRSSIGDDTGNQTAKLVASSTFALGYRGHRRIQSSHIEIRDGDNPASEISYSITAVPTTGTLYLDTTALGLNGNFSQADINNGRLSFLQTGGYATSDSFSYAATSLGGGPQVTGTFVISVNPYLSYSRVRSLYKTNTAITVLSPSVAGFTPSSYSVNVALPTGLSLDTTTGTLSGTPTAVTAAADYTITATDGTSVATHTINIQVMDGFIVNNNGDGTDATPGNGVCETVLGNGICTLRAAVGEVIGLAASRVIVFDAAVTTVTLGSALPNITASVTVVGNGRDTTEIDCNNGAYRAFATTGAPAKTLTVSDLTIKRCAPASTGGAILVNGAAHTLDIFNVKFDSNSGTNGGAIYAFGILKIDRCVFDSNSASGDAGAIYSTHTLANTLNITRNAFTDNTAVGATGGGAIYTFGSGLNIGIYNLQGNLFSGNEANTASACGGALLEDGGYLNLKENTFVNNSADYGGAYCDLVPFLSGLTATMYNNTFYSNSALTQGGAIYTTELDIDFKNNIVANNTAPVSNNCDDFFARINSLGYNISDDATCNIGAAGDLPSQTVADIGVSAITDNETFTLQPGFGSSRQRGGFYG